MPGAPPQNRPQARRAWGGLTAGGRWQRKLAEWWADKMSGGDVQKTFVDKEEKIRLAEHVGLTERKINYWLW